MFEVADYIQIGLMICLIVQVFLAARQFSANQRAQSIIFRADHERRKKQSTFEFINAVSDRYKSAIGDFDKKHTIGKVVDRADFDDDDVFFVKTYLNEIERICAGVNAGVFDYEILKKMMGTNLMRSHDRFVQYIQKAQIDNPKVYIEFGEVVRRLKEDQGPAYQNIGSTVYS